MCKQAVMNIYGNRNIIFLCLFLMLIAGTVTGISLELDLVLGFDDRYRPGTAVPVTITVRSPGAPLEADLVLEYVAGTSLERGASWTVIRRISLAPDVTGVYRFAIPLKVSSYPLKARLERNGIALIEAERELRPAMTDRSMVVGLSDRPSLDSAIPALSRRYGRSPELLYPRPEYLPIYPASWDGVELVIWHRLSPDELDLSAFEALVLWVADGGNLIIIGNPRLSGHEFPESVPVGQIGFPIPVGDLAVYPIANEPEGSLAGESRGIPTMQFFPYGLGKITYVPYDITSSLLSSADREKLWDDLISRAEPRRKQEWEPLVELITQSVFTRDAPFFPDIGGVLILATLFSGAAMVVLIYGRKADTPGSRRLILFALAVISAAASLAATTIRRPMEDRRLELRITGNRGAVEILDRYRFASSVRESIDIQLQRRSLPYIAENDEITILWTPSGALIRGWRLEPWTPSELTARSVLAGFGESELDSINQGTWRNNGTEELFDVVRLADGEVHFLAETWGPGEWLDAGMRASENSWPRDYHDAVYRILAEMPPSADFVLARMSPG
ncbi:MAG: hypothetical protein RQ801_07030, partial [Spirochaetaceae bacterium]|nr:hypothetical protein [Spirochaetaceae bacterium]